MPRRGFADGENLHETRELQARAHRQNDGRQTSVLLRILGLQAHQAMDIPCSNDWDLTRGCKSGGVIVLFELCCLRSSIKVPYVQTREL